MQRKGVRSGRSIANRVVAARSVLILWWSRLSQPRIVIAATFLLLSGCSSLQSKNESIVRVESKRNTARAIRLTHAGIHSLHKQHIDLAAKHFREAVLADPAYGPAHNNLGLMHYEQGNLYQAVMAFEQAREFLPDDPAVVYNLGLALESAGRSDEALDLYYTANAMDVANPNYLGNLVRLRVRLGEHDELLQQQLRDLVLIETRPEWRRWADTQLALTVNDALDRGPATPDLESTVNQTQNQRSADLRNKIIDLTPVRPTSMEQPVPEDPRFDDLPDEPAPATFPDETPMDLSAPQPQVIKEPPTDLEENVVEDLSEQGYYRE